jgi:hypothetical protein
MNQMIKQAKCKANVQLEQSLNIGRQCSGAELELLGNSTIYFLSPTLSPQFTSKSPSLYLSAPTQNNPPPRPTAGSKRSDSSSSSSLKFEFASALVFKSTLDDTNEYNLSTLLSISQVMKHEVEMTHTREGLDTINFGQRVVGLRE